MAAGVDVKGSVREMARTRCTDFWNCKKWSKSFLEEYFNERGIRSDIFYIDLSMEAPFYCAPLQSKVQFTDYYPPKLEDFEKRCQRKPRCF